MDPLAPHYVGNESPPAVRHHILGSFLRGRPRGSSQSHINLQDRDPANREQSPPPPLAPSPSSPSPSSGHRRRPAAVGSSAIQSSTSQNSVLAQQQGAANGLAQMLRRRRSAGALASSNTPQVAISASAPGLAGGPRSAGGAGSPLTMPGHRIRLVPHVDSRRSLRFEAISRDVKEGDIPLRIGRFTDRSGLGIAAANALGSNKLAFKSKVVSRSHAEIWVEGGGKFFIKDTKSSSGTFLNHVRLSPANSESRPHELKDGDILQLGVDYQGGTEDIYKCVKIRVEVNREWQSAANAFNTNALKQLKALAIPQSKTAGERKMMPKSGLADCCICLFSVTVHQALFIAPCSHCFHFKCIKPLLDNNHPAFSCPLCRTYADLEDDVEVDVESVIDPAELDMAVDAGGATGVVASIRRERDREDAMERAGAETEVEGDTGGTRVGRGRRGLPMGRNGTMINNPNSVDHLAEEDDVDSDVEPPLPALPERGLGRAEGFDVLSDHDAQMTPSVSRENSMSPGIRGEVNGPSGGRAGSDLSEGEGSGSGSAEGMIMVAMDQDGEPGAEDEERKRKR